MGITGKTYTTIRILPVSTPSYRSINKWGQWSVNSEDWTVEDCKDRIYKYFTKNLEEGFKFGIFTGFDYARGAKGYKRIKWELKKVVKL